MAGEGGKADRSPLWLLEHARDVHSQSGEDGILEYVLVTIPGLTGWCVEFGAGDGVTLSNTRNLIDAHGYRAVMVEADADSFRLLKYNCETNPNAIAVRAVVGWGKDDGLDTILASHPVPLDFDLLSIDIDGNDYHAWKAVVRYRPKAVVIEYNPTIPTEVRFVQRPEPNLKHGSSLLSLVELGKEKGYELVCVTRSNAIFVDAKYYPLFGIRSNAPQLLRTHLSQITWIFSGYDGTVFVRGLCMLPWHGLPMRMRKLQQIPRAFRQYPGEWGVIKRAAWVARLGIGWPRGILSAGWRSIFKYIWRGVF